MTDHEILEVVTDYSTYDFGQYDEDVYPTIFHILQAHTLGIGEELDAWIETLRKDSTLTHEQRKDVYMAFFEAYCKALIEEQEKMDEQERKEAE